MSGLSAEWIARARATPIENELARRGIELRGKTERTGPCPKCGGDDRFSINVKKRVFNCRGCGAGGDVIALVMLLDGCDFAHAATSLAGEPPRKPNGAHQAAGNGRARADATEHEPQKVCVASFDYVDESGAPAFTVDRLQYKNPDGSFVLKDGKPRKTFTQKRLDPKRSGTWIFNVEGAPVVPYRLPELTEAIGAGHAVLIAEGEAKVDLLRSWNIPATCCAGGAKKWRAEHSKFLRGADVVILPDNDRAGREHVDVVGASLRGIAKSVRVLELPGCGPKEDIIDWAATQFNDPIDEFHKLIGAQARPWTPHAKPKDQADAGADPAHKFPLIRFANIHVDTTTRNYLVKGLLASTGLAVIWGPPKCGKSFWAIDLALHVALGWKYRGRHVKQAPIIYVALEGQSGIDARADAFKRHHKIDDAPFFLIKVRLDLIAHHAALVADIKAQIGAVMPGAVFIDTLNRSLVGSESKDEDMGRYLAAAEYLGAELGCAVVIVHHCGIDATRPRGHTSLTGSVESQLKVERGDNREVIVTVEYAKDFEEGIEIYSRLEPVPLGTDLDGDEISSLVVLPVDVPAGTTAKRPKRKLSDRQTLGLAALVECLCISGKLAPASWQLPAGIKTVSLDAWHEELYRRGVIKRDAKNPRTDLKRLRESLQARELIGVRDDQAWKA